MQHFTEYLNMCQAQKLLIHYQNKNIQHRGKQCINMNHYTGLTSEIHEGLDG